jgi:hypothetical protein
MTPHSLPRYYVGRSFEAECTHEWYADEVHNAHDYGLVSDDLGGCISCIYPYARAFERIDRRNVALPSLVCDARCGAIR